MRFERSLLGATLFLALACGTSGIQLPSVGAAPSGESVVFGSVEVEGKLLAKAPVITPGGEEISVWDLGADEEIATGDPGEFYWHLPPGRYAIMHYREDRTIIVPLVASQRKWHELKLAAEFTVPEEPSVLYIGTLRLVIEDEDHIKKSIRDDFDTAVSTFRSKYPRAKGSVTKQLMAFAGRD